MGPHQASAFRWRATRRAGSSLFPVSSTVFIFQISFQGHAVPTFHGERSRTHHG
jgi:hypothetical protein